MYYTKHKTKRHFLITQVIKKMLVTLAEQSNKKYFIQEMRRIITRTRINTQEDDRVRNPQIAMF